MELEASGVVEQPICPTNRGTREAAQVAARWPLIAAALIETFQLESFNFFQRPNATDFFIELAPPRVGWQQPRGHFTLKTKESAGKDERRLQPLHPSPGGSMATL